MKRFYTAESVTEGHPDKLCDLIADSVLDACLSHDALARVACEVMAAKGRIIVAGEITSLYEPEIPKIVRRVLSAVGYDPSQFSIQCLIHKQSPDIAAGVDCSLEQRRNGGQEDSVPQLGAGDQGVMVGYACNETPEMLPLPVILAHRLTISLALARRYGLIHGLRPDGKAQVTVEYGEDGKPLRLDTVVVSAQHSPVLEHDELCWELTDKVLFPALQPLPPDEDTKILINPSGRFVLGGPEADTGLTGRKLMVDTYGSMVSHGGGAFSGKDPTKVDRSGAYMARYIAKELGVLTVGVVTKPFGFEGQKRMRAAEAGIEQLRGKVDSLVIIPNERLKHATDQKITFANAFEIADDVLRQAVQSISDLIRDTGFINLDFADVTAIMKNAGMAHMGVGRAAGKGKAEEAARMAISSPLLETSIEGAKGVLINVTGSMDIGLEEVEQAASLVQQAVHPDALTIFGATFDETMDDEIRVTVIATGFDKNPADDLPKIGTFAKPPVQLEGQEKDEQPKAPFAPIEPIAPAEEKPAEPEEDPFDDIFKIFNRRD